jgi:hypothetical protein
LVSEPFFSNVNPDPMLSHVLKHVVAEGVTVVGRDERAGGGSSGPYPRLGGGTGDKTPRASFNNNGGGGGGSSSHFYLTGPSIQVQHAVVQRDGDKVCISAGGGDAAVLVNGRAVSGVRLLEHLDRVVFSPGHAFLFHAAKALRGAGEGAKNLNVDSLDYDFIQMEIASAQGLEDMLRLGGKEATTAGGAGVMGAGGGPNAALTAEQRQLRQDLLHLAPMVTQANAISAELNRGARLELLVRSGAAHALNDKTKAIMVQVGEWTIRGYFFHHQLAAQVTNIKTGYVWHWTKAKFVNRCRFMQVFGERGLGV